MQHNPQMEEWDVAGLNAWTGKERVTMFGCWRTMQCTAAEVPGWAVTLLQRVRSVCNLIHAVFVFCSLSWCLHDSALLPCSPRLLPAAPAPPRPALSRHYPGHVLLPLLTTRQMIRLPNYWRPLTGYTGHRTCGLQETACSRLTILAYVGGEQSPAPGGVTVTSTAAGTAQVCRSSVQLQMHTEEHCTVLLWTLGHCCKEFHSCDQSVTVTKDPA